jgi:hypothetical protein
MSDNITSLWPISIKPKVMSPVEILTAQAEGLAHRTAGVLQASVREKEIREVEGKRTIYKVSVAFDIVVPALDGYHHRIMNIYYNKNFPYPALVEADAFRENVRGIRSIIEALASTGESKPFNRADNDEELFELIKKVITSPRVVSIAQSLIVRATEALNKKENQMLQLPSQSVAKSSPDESKDRSEAGGQNEEIIETGDSGT